MLIKLLISLECESCGKIIPPGGYIFRYKKDYYCHKCISHWIVPPKTFGERFRALRKANRLSGKDFAAKCTLSASSVTHYELYDKLPRADSLALITKLFDTTSDYLIGLTDDPNRRQSDE